MALEHVRGQITRGILKPDDRIRQEQLAVELGLSVVPVREALKTLEAEGQVVYRPHRGYHVTRLSLDELTQTYRARQLLEDDIVRVGAPLLAADDFAVLDELMSSMESADDSGDLRDMIEANRQFHFHLFGAANKPLIVNVIRMLWQSTESYRSFYYSHDAARSRVNREHRSIVEALRAGDVDRAVTELDQHRENAVAAISTRLLED